MYPHLQAKSHLALLLIALHLPAVFFAQISKDGSKTVSATNVVFNRYDRLASSASSGTTSITVSNIANLWGSAINGSANNPYSVDTLGFGDLIMIIKMQGAAITSGNVANSPVNSNPPQADVYGKITAYNGVGTYELFQVKKVTGNVIDLVGSLTNSYIVSGIQRVQVVRIPRLNSLLVNSGSNITGLTWSSSFTGGIVALEVSGDAVINGTINASGIGFRGGAVLTTVKPLGGQFNQYDFVSNNLNYGGEKGESVAGTQADYDANYGGRYKRGAPANGGGGGNANCAGGGGGANASGNLADTSNYKGWGIPDNTPSGWSSAWDLEQSIIGFSHSSTSSGGGRGGYTYSGASKNPLSVSPGTTTWSGDRRKIGGGWGGRPLLYYASNVLFMGGGGGAGDADDQSGGSGGNGGGIIYMLVNGNVSGTGTINADGNAGENTINRTSPFALSSTGRDGAGGGGGGGAVFLNVQGSIAGISVSAKGGNGGNQIITAVSNSETEGPGGGGGGGYIAVTGTPSIVMSTEAGKYGTSDCTQMSAFTANGATSGSGGASVTGLPFNGPLYFSLPIKLNCFEIVSTNEKALIKWAVNNESDMRCYELEQKTATSQWRVTARVAARNAGNSIENYSLNVDQPIENTFYRLRSVSNNGLPGYTCVKTLQPSSLSKIKVTVSAEKIFVSHLDVNCFFKIYNSQGQEMRVNINQMNSLSTIDKNWLPKGIYYLQIGTANNQMVYKFIN